MVHDFLQYPAQIVFDSPLPLPLGGVAKGNFFKTHTVPHLSVADMQMPVDDRADRKAPMPIIRAGGATPNRKAGNAWQHRHLLAQWEVIDQDQLGSAGRGDLQPLLAIITAGHAPGGPAGIGVRVKQMLIRTDGLRFFGPGHGLLGGQVGGSKAVVIEQKEGSK